MLTQIMGYYKNKQVSGLVIKLGISLFFLIPHIFLLAQKYETEFRRGVIVDSVKCKINSSESYSLYLPENYDQIKEWPVLMIFDPAARGKLAISKFIPAGKKFGYILACSNNVKNGDFSEMLRDAGIMFEDVVVRFNVDKRRLFTAGFSGASRLASGFSINNKKIAGVIGCGAGLPDNVAYEPEFMSHLIYFGLVGNKDMNYQEMNDLGLALEKLKMVPFIKNFNGGHDWPSEEDLMFALSWIELKMMKRGIINKRDDLIEEFEKGLMDLVRESEKKSELVDAGRYYKYAIRDLQDLKPTDDISSAYNKVEQSKMYKNAITKRGKIHEEEIRKREIFNRSLTEIVINNGLSYNTTNWWKDEIEALKSGNSRNRYTDSLMSYRLLNLITISSIEIGSDFYSGGRYEVAKGFFKVWTFCEPGIRNSWYNLARACAFNGNSDEAIYALDRSLKNGYIFYEFIMNEPAFKTVHEDKRFKNIISRLQKKYINQ
jgi:hypothetical protein